MNNFTDSPEFIAFYCFTFDVKNHIKCFQPPSWWQQYIVIKQTLLLDSIFLFLVNSNRLKCCVGRRGFFRIIVKFIILFIFSSLTFYFILCFLKRISHSRSANIVKFNRISLEIHEGQNVKLFSLSLRLNEKERNARARTTEEIIHFL